MTTEGPKSETTITDDELQVMARERFQGRVERVLAVMREERIDWRGIAFIAPDGRIGVRVMPVDLSAGLPAGLAAGRLAEMGQP
jgi:hypothetical protein